MTVAQGVRRWPIHPRPRPGEALTSWLGRLAAVYRLSVGQLLQHNLGPASALLNGATADDLDWDPPLALLEALAMRTGTESGELRLMTVGGWVPWLADTLDAERGSEAFHTYTRQDSVLLIPGEAGTNAVERWLPWLPADRPTRRAARRICPVCAAAPDPITPLTATIPLMLSCPEHGCRLEAEGDIALAAAMGKPPPHRTAPEHIQTLDRLTWMGMTTGTVVLPRQAVHVGLWLRMLRTLLDEVSISTSRLRRRSAAALELIWNTAAWPPRAGISVWRPYETLSIARQEAMLEATATALDLIRTGKITTCGTLGHLLTRQSHQDVYDGDRPDPAVEVRAFVHDGLRRSWEQATRDVEEWFATARTDPAVARQIFGILTHYSRTGEEYDRERDFMIRHGTPASFLPDPEPGRFAPSNGVR
ncbi:TniQ family protein [Actinocorallia libanotica]|uniref:TniQ family protein n=1 Tax=Actinocorallia libanotica TaxID=46162 RepID=A0ABP4CKP7_9ACTN